MTSAPGFEIPLATYLQAIEREARPTLLGRWLARVDVAMLLDARLRIRELEKRAPQIFTQPVLQTVFVTGARAVAPRCCIACSGRIREPHPADLGGVAPLPAAGSRNVRSSTRGSARSIGSCICGYRSRRATRPSTSSAPRTLRVRHAHEWQRSQRPAGDCLPTRQSYEQLVFGPGADLRDAYRWHRKVLQVLQWRMPGRWVLKAPSHLHFLDTLLDVYPDARFVQTHRDPLKVLPSVASLLLAQLSMRSDHVDVAALRLGLTGEGLAGALQRASALRDSGRLRPERVADVRYAALLHEPLAAVQAVYEHFGWPLTADAKSRIRAATVANPQGAHGEHRYAFEQLPLDRVAERRRFAAYQARYGVRPNSRTGCRPDVPQAF
jgi:hypothetical protein